MVRPKIGDQVTVEASANGELSSGKVVEGPWIANGDVQSKPTWKVDHGDGFSNWYLEDRIAPNPTA